MQSLQFDERDLKLLHALQIAPRVSWAEAARILESTPVTLASRWQRLRDEGLAWMTAHPSGVNDVQTAFVEVDCEPGRQAEALAVLQQDPRAVTIERSARGRDLLLTVMTRDLGSFSRFVLDDLGSVPGVQRQRSFIAMQIHRQGSNWRLNALDRDQQVALEAVAQQGRGGDGRLPRDSGPLMQALALDGRASASDLARATGRQPSTVRRQLGRLLASHALSFRCEVAQDPALWQIQCTWLARVPEQAKDQTVTALATLPELRLCVSTSGETNLYASVWARSLTDLQRLERLVAERLPHLTIVESVVNLRTVKRMGWILDERGRATGEVVVPTALAMASQP